MSKRLHSSLLRGRIACPPAEVYCRKMRVATRAARAKTARGVWFSIPIREGAVLGKEYFRRPARVVLCARRLASTRPGSVKLRFCAGHAQAGEFLLSSQGPSPDALAQSGRAIFLPQAE